MVTRTAYQVFEELDKERKENPQPEEECISNEKKDEDD